MGRGGDGLHLLSRVRATTRITGTAVAALAARTSSRKYTSDAGLYGIDAPPVKLGNDGTCVVQRYAVSRAVTMGSLM